MYISNKLLDQQVLSALSAVWKSFGVQGDKEQIVKDCHVMFEGVHPFCDGNGRVGRLLMNWQNLRLGNELKIIHTGKEQQDYYEWFR
jgi:fido (protein-threonine AMPylation protein)